MTAHRRYDWVTVAGGCILGNFHFIQSNVVLVLRGHSNLVPHTAGGGILGYAFLCCLYLGIFAYPLSYLHTAVTTKSKSSRMSLAVSLPLVLFGASWASYYAFDYDELVYIEGRSHGGGAAFGLLLVMFYLPVALLVGSFVGKIVRKIYRS